MGKAAVMERAHPLDERAFAASGVTITPAPSAFRTNLRCNEKDVAALSKALGLKLPVAPNQSVSKGGRVALWLGPDEWFILDEKVNPATDLDGLTVACSAVDISHRNTGIVVEGLSARDVINAGCPRDLSAQAFPVGACARTVFGKAEVLLYREREDRYRIEVWRSFSDYVFTHLETAGRAGA
ncbi:MAG: sarcosine oxidase subunit gamma [Pseudomonadota bacterium]